MKKIVMKLLIAAMVLSLSLSGGVTAFADTAAPAAGTAVVQADVTVHKAAKAYFENFPQDKHVISAADFLAKVQDGTAGFVIDLRKAEDYAKGHIQGAINIPYGAAVAEELDRIPDDQPVYVYCYSGQTASQTAALLNVAGKNAYNVSGGYTNGISKEAAAAGLTTTEPSSYRTRRLYPVDAQVQDAIAQYYDIASANGSFNLSAEKVKEGLESGEYFLVDVRSEEDFLRGHIPGAALNIPFGPGMQQQFGKLPRDQKIVVQCYSGQTASQVVGILRLLGYDAYNLSGGMNNGWKKAGYETTTATDAEYVAAKAMKYFATFPEDKNVISAEDFLRQVRSGKDVFIIDARSAEDYAKGHVKGAVNVPFGTEAVAESLEHIPADKPVYIYCYSGQTASQMTAWLNLAGKQAHNVSGGYNNGLSKVKNLDALLTTTASQLPEETFTTDATVAAAVADYFQQMAQEKTYPKFNISAAQLKERLDAGDESIYLVDIRPAANYQAGHIEGVKENIPYGKGMQTALSQLPKDKTIVLQCTSGQTSSQTLAIARALGYEAYSLSGGINGWTAAGYPVVK